MTDLVTHANAELSVPVDHVPGVRGYAVLAVGADGDGDEALAVWRLGPTGHASGAWIFRIRDLAADHERLRNVLWLLHGRCLVDWQTDRPERALHRVESWLPPELISALRPGRLVIPDLLREIRDRRQACAEAVERHRSQARSTLVPLSWPVEVPESTEKARALLTPRAPIGAAPVATEALALAGAVRRAVEWWQDTEQARYRRAYLRPLGEVQPLPPRWLAALRRTGDTSAAVGAVA